MAGKRLLDFAALFNASRGIAQKHVALRSRQLEVYNRTSTLARAVRSQTDRVTETVKAASLLASRLNEDAPVWTSDRPSRTPRRGEAVAGPESTAESSKLQPGIEIDQDHLHKESSANSAVDAPPNEKLDIKQESASRYPLPGGTIPLEDADLNESPLDPDVVSTRPQGEPAKKPLRGGEIAPVSSSASPIAVPGEKPSSTGAEASGKGSEQIPFKTVDALDGSVKGLLENGLVEDSFYGKLTHTSPTFSSLPRVQVPSHTSNIQGDPHLARTEINSDSFYSASTETGTEEAIPDGVNTDLFYSPRVATLLGGGTHGRRKSYEKKENLTRTSNEQVKAGKETGYGRVDTNQSPPISDTKSVSPEPASQSEKIDEDNGELAESTAEDTAAPASPHELRESKVPSSRLGRLWNYGGLAAGMVGGAISESIRRVGGGGSGGSYMLSAGNMDRLVTKLSRMRGAALKLGQVISFQDSKMLPEPIRQVLQRVQDRADYMPPSQRDSVLTANLGADWRDMFSSFDEKPLAAASIGQVHSAVLKSSGDRVAVKVQYPGVADSIDSDLSNLSLLLTASRLLPKGLFLDRTIANARTELAWECDYIREAECGRRFESLLADEKDVFRVPKVFSEASGKQVLTMEFMDGMGVTRVQSFTQEQKNWIGTQILRLCLREITEFRFMQTDPNWTNFLYNAKINKLELLDFGASREYPEFFITRYTQLLTAASRSDRDTVQALSVELGYLTGQESKAMLDAHITSILTLAEPFLDSSPEVYDFKNQTITDRVKELIPLMIRERLAPPPEETYSLHRKLSGAFLLCARLGSRVRCRELFENSMKKANLL
ncbi:probable abc1 protein precursor [Rhynchosporium agropyri]|uniref:Probable abc1 protein n=1 Tax=Rhynchosporium agropyri TaxID=914238 RepID=A0A1E1LT83_9HELO|nr:probable abc1 protein precursor [Rhynchosporium agropyri]